jgi:hypothetical protein
MVWATILLALSVPIVLAGGLWNRISGDKGIGWQFIRFTVLTISLPIIGVLALNNALPGEAAALIGGAMGFAFGKKDD